jgi:hypothetical protein
MPMEHVWSISIDQTRRSSETDVRRPVDPAIPDDITAPRFGSPTAEARRRRSIALAIGVGTAVTLVFGVQPILLGGLTEAGA